MDRRAHTRPRVQPGTMMLAESDGVAGAVIAGAVGLMGLAIATNAFGTLDRTAADKHGNRSAEEQRDIRAAARFTGVLLVLGVAIYAATNLLEIHIHIGTIPTATIVAAIALVVAHPSVAARVARLNRVLDRDAQRGPFSRFQERPIGTTPRQLQAVAAITVIVCAAIIVIHAA